jgi:hypothetical protein
MGVATAAENNRMFSRIKNQQSIYFLLQYMRQEDKEVLKNKQIPLDMLGVHDSQCGLLKICLSIHVL